MFCHTVTWPLVNLSLVIFTMPVKRTLRYQGVRRRIVEESFQAFHCFMTVIRINLLPCPFPTFTTFYVF